MSGEEAGWRWSLLGWLRRGSSSDSLSSGGSARTAASFAFLPGAASHRPAPRALPPPAPPSDTYRRRLRERDARRLHDTQQDLTLTRKYHLPGVYDASTLPPPRRTPGDRLRRAASETGSQRRPAYVPGKRPAPQPPRPRPKKRPAPPPPYTLPLRDRQKSQILREIEKIDYEMNNAKENESQNHIKSDNKQEKNTANVTNVKLRPERSFLKHIFENRKRNSAIETSAVKLLPSLRELDQQAAELLRARPAALGRGPHGAGDGQNSAGTWICTRCLRKYDMTVVTCLHCIFERNDIKSPTSVKKSSVRIEAGTSTNGPSTSMSEKDKLKEMLKEMKNSLPKRTKTNNNELQNYKTIENESGDSLEETDFSKNAPTLPIGEALDEIKNNYQKFSEVKAQDVSRNSLRNKQTPPLPVALPISQETIMITQTVVLQDPGPASPTKDSLAVVYEINKSETEHQQTKYIRNEEIKISSLLNPVYVPKSEAYKNSKRNFFLSGNSSEASKNNDTKVKEIGAIGILSGTSSANFASTSSSSIQPLPLGDQEASKSKIKTENANNKAIKMTSSNVELVNSKSSDKKNLEDNKASHSGVANIPVQLKNRATTAAVSNATSIPTTSGSGSKPRETLDQFNRRRDLINQLERSIARGDERAAADAAVKLAQLRLSCSVLSFSSQIAADIGRAPSTSLGNHEKLENTTPLAAKTPTAKVSTASQAATSLSPLVGVAVKSENTLNEVPSNNKKASVMATKVAATIATEKTKKEENAVQKTEPSTSKTTSSHDDIVNIEVWVEDKAAARGPARLRVSRAWRLRELRGAAERALAAPAPLQRWIVGRTLAADDDAALQVLAGPLLQAPFYLCLVESDNKKSKGETKEDIGEKSIPSNSNDDKNKANQDQSSVYNELIQLERNDILPNTEAFECGVCLERCEERAGCVVRECLHAFCLECLGAAVRHCEEAEVRCPAPECAAALQEREVRALVSAADYERWLARGLAQAESGARHAFHCRTRDCVGWALAEPPAHTFPCPVCRATNCVPCQAIHAGETCEQYKTRLKEAAKVEGNADSMDDSTKSLIDSLISRGEALMCPECSAIITKKWGCDWVRCSACKTEICWVTRGRRWGPGGRGDTSAGCRCGVDGRRCHPSCTYCH